MGQPDNAANVRPRILNGSVGPSHYKRRPDVKFFYGVWAILARRFTRTRRHCGGGNRKTLPISATVFWHASCELHYRGSVVWLIANQTACLEKTNAGM